MGVTLDGDNDVVKINDVQVLKAQEAAQADTAAATVDPLVITYTANTPAPAATQTIADGTVPTVAELGQYTANQELAITALVDDVAALRVTLNALLAKLRTHGIIDT